MAEYRTGKFLQTHKVTAWITDGIIYVRAKDRVHLELGDAQEMTGIFEELTNTPLPLLVDFHTSRGQSGDCRKYFARDENHSRLITATALMVNSPVSRMLSFFFVAVAKPIRPTQFFTSEKAAIDWLGGYKLQESGNMQANANTDRQSHSQSVPFYFAQK